ncbi:MAG: hypothetical protein GF401_10050 [Chitinivibrionales bacterium]|nr:hypothetical protein [Chitinivibrionales bacterium]
MGVSTEGIGRYSYHKPESTWLFIDSVEGQYSPQLSDNFLSGCSHDMHTTVLDAPIMSPSYPEALLGYNASVEPTGGNTLKLWYQDSITNYTFEYFIDTLSWTITKFAYYDESDILQYHTCYSWIEIGGIHVLKQVYINCDTSMSDGGYTFYDITVNDTLSVPVARTTPALGGDGFSFNPSSLILTVPALHSPCRIGIYTARGRKILKTVLTPGIRKFDFRNIADTGLRSFGKGNYIIRITGETFSATVPFTKVEN